MKYILTIEAAGASETYFPFYHSIRRYMTEDMTNTMRISNHRVFLSPSLSRICQLIANLYQVTFKLQQLRPSMNRVTAH
jgi:hypothetical protein